MQTITNQFHKGTSITPISALQYTYDVDDEVTSTAIQKQFATTITRSTAYDAAGQLLSLTASAGGGSNYKFSYDNGANRVSETVGATTTSSAYNNVNELTIAGSTYDNDGETPYTGGTDIPVGCRKRPHFGDFGDEYHKVRIRWPEPHQTAHAISQWQDS